ncbi:MAG TPA: hypothetical protein VJZ76_01680 [Thermoanaerobaculia bacterium]|nr:hypothetical protein [Thermoanaerobaculia bacterium]
MALPSLNALLSALTEDQWRFAHPYDTRFATAQETILSSSRDVAIQTLRQWLRSHQPCVFGRIAAAHDLISFCLLDEADLNGPDAAIQESIQAARTSWTRRAFRGEKSAFVVFLRSRRVVQATPDSNFLAFARRLCSLYLLTDIEPDSIYLDEIFLEAKDDERSCWRWNCGVNYFGAHADGRWWQDHRIPGGIAFSVNSVGHMVKAGLLSKAGLLEADSANIRRPVDSLEMSLELAMRTIANASDTISGRATWLEPSPESPEELPVATCPIDLPKDLADKNFCEYAGWYHTDYTLPSDYFSPNAKRSEGVPKYRLDFTYLFRTDVENPDFITTAAGRRIREDQEEEHPTWPVLKAERVLARRSPISANPRLVVALT